MKTYQFNNARDMIELAKMIQSYVYWGMRFYLSNEESDEYHYSDFWDVADAAQDNGAIGVSIFSDNVINFIYTTEKRRLTNYDGLYF